MLFDLTRRGFLAGLAAAAFAEKRNVLFLPVDDLRPELGCYGNTIVRTPNIDRLAARGITFTRAYCQQAVCNASRSSLLTGMRPDTTGVFENKTHFRQRLPDVVTLPEVFRKHGYQTRSFGKVFHEGMNDPRAWSTPAWPEKNAGMQYIDTEAWRRMSPAQRAHGPFPTLTWTKRESSQAPDVPDIALQDGETAERAIAALREMKDGPFFLAAGFQKPHLPFTAPKKYWNLYDRSRLPDPPNPRAPIGAPALALHASVEMRGYTDIPKEGPIPPAKVRELIHGYYAATSYTDAQVGRLLGELDRLGLAGSTTVMLFGDHGWHLGEHDLWAKTTNFELDARAPLIVAGPGIPRGVHCQRLVEFVDMYPTLCEQCGVPAPAGLEGASMVRLFADPQRPWKKAAFSQFPRPWSPSKAGGIMGRTMRTDRYRYTEWCEAGRPPQAVELYDHEADPRETVNVAQRPENARLIAELGAQLRQGWRAALGGAAR
jgi:iduronate 2-sulfatase